MNYKISDFYCINCGNKGIPISRKNSHLRLSGHRKRLFCPYCKLPINHVECRTEEDVKKFKQDFAEGLFKEEAKQSIVESRKNINELFDELNKF